MMGTMQSPVKPSSLKMAMILKQRYESQLRAEFSINKTKSQATVTKNKSRSEVLIKNVAKIDPPMNKMANSTKVKMLAAPLAVTLILKLTYTYTACFQKI